MLARIFVKGGNKRILACRDMLSDENVFSLSTIELVKELEKKGCKVINSDIRDEVFDVEMECPPCFKVLLVNCADLSCYMLEHDLLLTVSKGVEIP